VGRKAGPLDESVVAAVKRDLEPMGDLKLSALAASALALAAEMDDENSATSKSMCAKELRETMDRLRSLAPPREENDGVDDLTAQRKKRIAARARRAATANPSSS
jgi:hypothetical protein